MKRALFATSIVLPIAGAIGLVVVNCGNSTGTYVPPGGSSSSSGGGSGSSGSGSGGEMTGSSGSSSGAGTSSSSSSSGASTGSSGSSSGVAGSSSGAGSGSSGGSGSSSSGGSADGGAVSISSIFGIKNSFGESVMDSFMLFGCFGQAAQDCITNAPGTACPPSQGTAVPLEQQGIVTHEYFTIGGTVGTMYVMTLQVNGILEAKYYENGTRFVGNGDPANPDVPTGTDTFYTGGDPVNIENYNVYKITVRNPPAPGAMPSTGTEVQHYYLNSFPKTNTPYENHETFPISWIHDIPVPGGGVIEYLTEDRNCHAVDNCGIGARSVSCAVGAGRNVPNEPTLVVPTNYMGQAVSGLNTRNGASQPFHAQIAHLTVTAVRVQ